MVKGRKKKSAAGRVFILLFILLLGAAGWASVRYLRSRPAPGPAVEGGTPGSGAPAPAGVATPRSAAMLYFSAPDGALLAPERRIVALPEDTLDRCRSILEELKKGPRQKAAPLLLVDLELRSLFLVDTVLVIDLQPKVRELAVGALQEALLWYSVVNSLIANNPDKVSAIHFLVDGAEADTILGHLDMRGPFRERPDLVRPEGT